MRVGVPGFIPARLAQAREARGLSLTGLADLTGVSRQSISSYENGKQIPTIQVLKNISEKLNLPKQFFLKDLSAKDNNPIFFRSLSAATKQARIRAEKRIEWMGEILDYLDDFIEFLPVNLPIFQVGKEPINLSNDDIETFAANCRRELGLGNGPISHMVRLLENHGVIVARLKLDTPAMDSFSKWYAHKNIPIIVLGDDKRNAARSRFDAAHELGHLVLHWQVEKTGRIFKEIEEQAFRFGSAFLLPAETFTRDFSYPTLDAFRTMKEKWKVSIKAMIKRCQELNIISDSYATKLYINYNRRGWGKREPLDDELNIEQPVFNRRCIELIIKENVQSREEILGNLALAESDIEELLALPRGFLSHGSNIEPLPQLRKAQIPKNNPSDGTVIPFPPKKTK